MGDHWESRCVISGIGLSSIGRRTGIPGLTLTEAACREAVADAGLRMSDIDGLTTVGETPLAAVRDRLGLRPRWSGEGGSGIGGVFSAVLNAGEAVARGDARHVLVYRTVGMMNGSIFKGEGAPPPADLAGRSDDTSTAAQMGDVSELLAYHAYAAPNWLGMHARRHMHLYGTTKQQMGWLAITSRRHASLNPKAVYREPLTMEQYLDARMISDPIGLYDCDVPVDGSCAVVISVVEHAPNCPRPALRVNAAGRAPGKGGWLYRSDYPKMASADAAKVLWNRTDLKPADIDVAEIYDGFSFLTMAWLEALGICGEGESGPFVEGGTRIALDGELPLNTYGGQLSAGRMHGYWVLHEACTQLRGDADTRQVPGAEVAVVTTGGGPLGSCMLLTR